MAKYPQPTPIFDNLNNFDLALPKRPVYPKNLLIA